MMGGPGAGFLPAGLSLGGGALPTDASGRSGTNVFMNARELHQQDVVNFARQGITVFPGRWWVDALGNCGLEGNFAPFLWDTRLLNALLNQASPQR